MLTRYLLPLLAAAALGFALLQMSKAQQKPPPAAPPVEPATSPFGTQLAGAGIVEPETENITVGSHVPGVVDEVFVKVGDTVKPGTPLFRLDDRHLKAELETRVAAQANAEAMLRKLENQPRPEELPPAEAKVAEAKATVKDATQQYERFRRISTSAVSEEELTRREVAVEVARAQLAKAEADLKLLKAGAWQPDKDIQAAMVRQAKAQATQTQTELDRLTVRTPRMAGPGGSSAVYQVLQVNTRPGEFVMAGQGGSPMILGHVGKLHVRVDIDENDIPRFRPNLPGVAKPRGSPGQSFPLTFVRVEPYVIPKRSLTGANTERVDTRVLQVIYALDTGGRPLYVGQQVDVFFDTTDNK
jgi:multidrug resistance efflux pump